MYLLNQIRLKQCLLHFNLQHNVNTCNYFNITRVNWADLIESRNIIYSYKRTNISLINIDIYLTELGRITNLTRTMRNVRLQY